MPHRVESGLSPPETRERAENEFGAGRSYVRDTFVAKCITSSVLVPSKARSYVCSVLVPSSDALCS